ncbi:winged helix-turn-helix transcriptional regulator [Amycolatopsis jejuensis]|uniref:winged helix-turn-helix transcriptional regulator n=1 Tax=Amycolatopsis jejuensis TaxID=330084 RepID=UPI00052767D3|nr:helix-turn-helix domain-containing protein [Amycolatopsis jejuensis]
MSQGNIAVTDQAETPDPGKLAVCTVMEVVNRISGKWAIGILLEATRGPVRFTELERSVSGISRRMLTLTLRNLERDGLLERTVYPTVPPRVEYEATGMARELYESLSALVGWAERHREAIALARDSYDGRG